ETMLNTNKQQNTALAPPRLQNVLKNHASHQSQKVETLLPSATTVQPLVNLWMNNNVKEHTTSGNVDLRNNNYS
ncbi:unnamed protein product, partial [Rotaria socialis]